MNLNQKTYFVFLLYCLYVMTNELVFAQTKIFISGQVKDVWSDTSVPDVAVSYASYTVSTDNVGKFRIAVTTNQPEVIIEFRHSGFYTVRVPLRITGQEDINMGTVYIKPDKTDADLDLIVISPEELTTTDQYQGSSAILQSQRSVFSNAAAFQWSSSFFRPRGYDSEHQTILINGISMNTTATGRPD